MYVSVVEHCFCCYSNLENYFQTVSRRLQVDWLLTLDPGACASTHLSIFIWDLIILFLNGILFWFRPGMELSLDLWLLLSCSKTLTLGQGRPHKCSPTETPSYSSVWPSKNLQETKLRPIISVTRWLLPLGHELSDSQYLSLDVAQESYLELSSRWTDWGLILPGWNGRHWAQHSPRWPQNTEKSEKMLLWAECNNHNCSCLPGLSLKCHTNSTQVSCCLSWRWLWENFSRWELLQGSLLAGGVAAGPLVATPVRLNFLGRGASPTCENSFI